MKLNVFRTISLKYFGQVLCDGLPNTLIETIFEILMLSYSTYEA